MTLCQIDNVDIIANSGTVPRRIVQRENFVSSCSIWRRAEPRLERIEWESGELWWGAEKTGDCLPSPNTSNFSRFPVATWPNKGKRLNGTPRGSSPMMPLG